MSILFITSTHIGDGILSSGLLRWLLDAYPDDGVTIACGAPAAKVFAATPRLETIHTIRKQRHHRHWLDLWRAVAPRRWRVVVDLRRSALPWALWARQRRTVPKPRTPMHRVALIAQTLDLPPQDPVVWTDESHRRAAATLLDGHGDLLALAPGATWAGKIWPSARFGDLARRLVGDGGLLPGGRVVLVGAESERETGDAVREALPADRIVDGFGTDVLTTHEVMRRCRLMVGNDSAMMHLAAASGVPTAGLFGPTNDTHYAPWGPNGLVVRTPESIAELTGWPGYDTKATGTLMTGLTVDAVAARIRARWPDGLPPAPAG